jgi:hypothetical protein
MLEILKILTKAALKLLNPEAIEKFRREGAQRKLGTSLFRLYIGLMDLIMQGESLLKIVQDAVEHKSLINYSANWRNTYNEQLRIGVERQAAVVEKFTTTFAQFFRMCCNFAVEPKIGLDGRKFSLSPRTDRE